MKKKIYMKVLAIVLCAFFLTGCQKVKNEIGRTYPEQKISEDKIVEKGGANKIEETAPQETYVNEENPKDMQLNKEDVDSNDIIQEQWKDSYRDIISNIDKNLVDPYSLRTYQGKYYYIGIHDFDDDVVPELIIGDGISVAIFTYENNTSKKIVDLYEPVDWGGINGIYFNDNMLLLKNAGSDGCGYVGFTYDKGEYIIGIYDDYNPEVATINEKQVSGEEFRKQFDLTEFWESDKGPTRIKLWENVSSLTRIKIEHENKVKLMIEDEEVVIDNLDFRILQW